MSGPAGAAQSVLGPLQAAIYARLTGPAGAALQALLGRSGADTGVYDEPPETAACPYVRIGEGIETPDNSHDRFGRSTLLTIHVWSRYRGFKQANGIVAAIVGLLDHQPGELQVAGHDVISIRFLDARPVPDPDPAVRHIPVRIRVSTEQHTQ